MTKYYYYYGCTKIVIIVDVIENFILYWKNDLSFTRRESANVIVWCGSPKYDKVLFMARGTPFFVAL